MEFRYPFREPRIKTAIAHTARHRHLAPMKYLPALAALFLSLVAARADQTADQSELLRLEKTGAAAIISADLKALGEFFSADWKIVDSDASMMEREQLFKAMKDGVLTFASYEQSELEVRIYGDAAVVIGTGKSKGAWNGESFKSHERFTDVFIRREGKWLCVSTHTSEFPEGK